MNLQSGGDATLESAEGWKYPRGGREERRHIGAIGEDGMPPSRREVWKSVGSPTRPLQLTRPSVAALPRGLAAERQTLGARHRTTSLAGVGNSKASVLRSTAWGGRVGHVRHGRRAAHTADRTRAPDVPSCLLDLGLPDAGGWIFTAPGTSEHPNLAVERAQAVYPGLALFAGQCRPLGTDCHHQRRAGAATFPRRPSKHLTVASPTLTKKNRELPSAT
jgi:hypothetical protein